MNIWFQLKKIADENIAVRDRRKIETMDGAECVRGSFAQVMQQSIERVQLKVMGSIVQVPSAEFLQQPVRNLSSEGFGIAVTFGIDYRHQSIALDQVTEGLRASLETAFARADFAADLKDLQVEFKAAGVNSLDYLVYASMDGNAAANYFAIGRLIQQACVDACNREGWEIPFTQLTLHQADVNLGGAGD